MFINLLSSAFGNSLSACLSDLSVSVSLGNFTVEKVRFFSICFSPRNRSIFQDVFKSSISKDGQPHVFSSCFFNQILKRKSQLLIQWNACFYETDLCHSKWLKDTITLGIYGCISSVGNTFPYKLDNKVFYQSFNIAAHTGIAFYFLERLHEAWKERMYCFTSQRAYCLINICLILCVCCHWSLMGGYKIKTGTILRHFCLASP